MPHCDAMPSFCCTFGYDFFGEAMRTMSVPEAYAFINKLPTTGKACGFFGDSHLRTFFCPEKKVYAEFGIDPYIAYLSGATVLGFGRRASRIGHFQKIEAFCKRHQPSHTFLKFGQVDMELGFLYRRAVKQENITMEEFIPRLAESYLHGIQALTAFTHPVVCGINLPTIVDADDYATSVRQLVLENITDPDVIHIYLRYLPRYVESYENRQRAAMLFNKKMADAVSGLCNYIDISQMFLKDGVLNKTFRQQRDTHYKISNAQRQAVTRHILSRFFCPSKSLINPSS